MDSKNNDKFKLYFIAKGKGIKELIFILSQNLFNFIIIFLLFFLKLNKR